MIPTIVSTENSGILKSLGLDLHMHVLPGIDDGAQNMQDSLALIDAHYRAGIRKIIATPHIRVDFFKNTEESIYNAWLQLTEVTKEQYPDLTIQFAAEYFADDYFLTLLEKKEILPISGNYVLIETSLRHDQVYFRDILKEMILQGYQPVVAHPERYQAWHVKPERYAEIYELGVIFQINILSIGGAYGPTEQITAERLIQQGWIGALGSDLHRVSQYKYIKEAVENPYFKSLKDTRLLNHILQSD
jgi:tyrosine-protein phosphatase YwqE